MLAKLVWENIKHRPLRTLLSAMLIAIPVTLVLTLVGLSRGMVDASKKRAQGVGADIVIRPKSSSAMATLSATIPERVVETVAQQPHVTHATGVIIQPVKGFLASAAGIDLASFNKMSGGFTYVAGGPFKARDEIVIDEAYAEERNAKVGSTIELLNQTWRVTGIVQSGVLNRIFSDIHVMQEITANTGKISQIYVKVDDARNIPAVVSQLQALLVDYPIFPMEEFMSQFSASNIPELNVFIQIMVGISVTIGFAVVFLSMYMAVLQRTREIGILKSLGASKGFVLGVIEREAVILAVAGTAIGIGLSFASCWALNTFVPSSFTAVPVPDWWWKVLVISLVGAIFGALYPGWRAASQDPIEALAYE